MTIKVVAFKRLVSSAYCGICVALLTTTTLTMFNAFLGHMDLGLLPMTARCFGRSHITLEGTLMWRPWHSLLEGVFKLSRDYSRTIERTRACYENWRQITLLWPTNSPTQEFLALRSAVKGVSCEAKRKQANPLKILILQNACNIATEIDHSAKSQINTSNHRH